MYVLFRASVYASARLGAMKGNFPGYKPVMYGKSNILKAFFTAKRLKTCLTRDILEIVLFLVLLLVDLLVLCLNVSTGIEPWFLNSLY